VSPYAVQKAPTDHTYYTQVNMTRTIEQILGLPPMNQFDLVASPMRTAFVTGTPPKANFAPFAHLKNNIPLDQGVSAVAAPAAKSLRKLAQAWKKMKVAMFAGKLTKPDGHAQPPGLVRGDQLQEALSRREEGALALHLRGSPGTGEGRRRRRRLTPVAL
jgi:hypothetical protein